MRLSYKGWFVFSRLVALSGFVVVAIGTVPDGRLSVWELKGKERKEVYLYSAFIVATTLKALRRGSHSFTCK